MLRKNPLIMSTYEAGLIQAQGYRTLKVFLDGFLKKYDLRMQEWALMGIVHDNKDLSLRKISDILDVEAPLTTRMVAELVRKGLLERAADPEDARIKVVNTTAIGDKLVNEVEAELRTKMREFLKGISPRELATYLKVLKKIADRA